jgi:predicted transcriptional regulator
MRNRDRMEIISRILEAVNGGGGATRTRIMYHAFVSHAQMKEYLSYLADNGMLYYDLESQKFKITEKGLEFVRIYTEIDEMIKIPPAPSPLPLDRQRRQLQQQYLMQKNNDYPSGEEEEEKESLEVEMPSK